MKIKRLLSVVASCSLCLCAIWAAEKSEQGQSIVPDFKIPVQGGPGLVVSGSGTVERLPQKAREILNDYYSSDSIKSIKENYIKHNEEVVLSDGTKILFNAGGDVINVYQGQNKAINPEMLGRILPEKTVEHLLQAGVVGEVSAVHNADKTGHCVMLLNNIPPQMIFDVDGVFIITAG